MCFYWNCYFLKKKQLKVTFRICWVFFVLFRKEMNFNTFLGKKFIFLKFKIFNLIRKNSIALLTYSLKGWEDENGRKERERGDKKKLKSWRRWKAGNTWDQTHSHSFHPPKFKPHSCVHSDPLLFFFDFHLHPKKKKKSNQMWQVLLAAAVAGSGILARNLFSNSSGDPTSSPSSPPLTESRTHDDECADQSRRQKPPPSSHFIPDRASEPSRSGVVGEAEEIFRFSSSAASKQRRPRPRGFKKKVEVERFSLCFKKRRTGKASSVKSSTGEFLWFFLSLYCMPLFDQGKYSKMSG